jgi:pyruvate dehydrogenase E1 component
MRTALADRDSRGTETAERATIGGDDALSPTALACLEELHREVQWFSAWIVHHANHVRPHSDGLKVGGHQASSASLATVLTALYFRILKPQDRVAVKPQASPAYHAIQYLLGRQSLQQLKNFRGFGGAQAYPSRNKDKDDVDFSTGSVGLGVGLTVFVALAQDYLVKKNLISADQTGRMIALVGDAELDEGNIHEALIEGWKHDLRNVWWIIDYNRQSLDAVTADRLFSRYEAIFHAAGWEVVTIKYGILQQAAFKEPGGEHLKEWIDRCPNAIYSALTFKGGAAWRSQLLHDAGQNEAFCRLIESYSDDKLNDLMVNLGGHDLPTLIRSFEAVATDKPHCFIAYTIKGWGLPFQGHKDNHAGLMSPAQMEVFQRRMHIPCGEEWHPFAGQKHRRDRLRAFLAQVPFAEKSTRRFEALPIPVPSPDEFPCPNGEKQSTQVAFGRIMNGLGRGQSRLADRIVTTSPDVTVSTNLGSWVNQRGVYHRTAQTDAFSELHVASMQQWSTSPQGQHIELGIAENNLFLLLGAFGLTASLFGERLLPVGSVYDPFIARGLDAMNYACYQDARFLLVATPSGVTLAPEGGAHQSVYTPLIGMGQDRLTYFEPAYVDELSEIMRWSFQHMQSPRGGPVYLRLSTRPITQPVRECSEPWRRAVLQGGYWRTEPGANAAIVIAYAGAVAPDAQAAFERISASHPDAGLLAITSPDRLHSGWIQTARGRRQHGTMAIAHIERLLRPLARNARIVTVLDGAPETLAWLGAVFGHQTVPLGVCHFGQSGDVPSLYAEYGIDADAITAACCSPNV